MLKSLNVSQIMLLGIPVLFLLSFLTHFIYDFAGENFVLGLFFPTDESVFQHLKLFTVTGFLYYFIFYFIKKETLNPNTWFTSALISMLLAVFLMPMLHYLFVAIAGTEIVLADILIALVAIAIAQFVALHYYTHANGINAQLAITLMLCTIFIFASLTLFPPNTPFFISKV